MTAMSGASNSYYSANTYMMLHRQDVFMDGCRCNYLFHGSLTNHSRLEATFSVLLAS